MLSASNDSIGMVGVFLYLYVHYKPDRDCIVDLTQEEIANLVGISRVQACRALKPLRDMGIIETHSGFIKVLDEARLKAMCSASVVGD